MCSRHNTLRRKHESPSLLNEKANIQLGVHQVKKEYLITLTRKDNKGVHQMLESDFDSTDKRDYGAVVSCTYTTARTCSRERLHANGFNSYTAHKVIIFKRVPSFTKT
jgi:pSer/pThr/pTyr-binding forkhead associated (FHA) protein